MSVDLLSTRPGTTPQDRACARLLTRVITDAVDDASLPLDEGELALGINLRPRACDALRFLFEKGEPFEAYARLIGSNATAIRERLLLDPKRRVLRRRYDLSHYFVRGVEATT